MQSSRSFICILILAVVFYIQCEAHIRMGIAMESNYIGDRETAWRIKIAAERLGWDVFLDESSGSQIKDQTLDWVICMLPKNQYFDARFPNYLMVFHPFNYLDKERKFKSFYEKYDGYLLTINDRESLENGLKKKNKEFNYIPFYPTVYEVPYQELNLNHLMVMIPVWGNRLTDPKFRTLHSLLSQTGFAKFYGVHPNEDIITDGYMGSIPFDGVSVIDILQQHGITLVMHSEIHNKECIPSSRIFEAAAASTVIISDENPFVKQHFGDSVFYIDTTLPAEDIADQIQLHMQTIFENPKNSLEMAQKAHQIFIEKFTMENQLLELEKLHQIVQLQKLQKKAELEKLELEKLNQKIKKKNDKKNKKKEKKDKKGKQK